MWRLAAAQAAGAAAGAAVLAWFGPPGADLAAHVYQRALFLEHGFSLWNNLWYSGRYSYVTYSLVYYPVAAVLGIKLLAVCSAAVAAAAFALLVAREWPTAGRWPARTFTLVAAVSVLTGAFPYAVGLALGLVSLLALVHGRTRWFAALLVLTFATSPLAFAMLVVILSAAAIAKRPRAAAPVIAVLGTAAAGLALWRTFPSSGRYSFSPSELAGILAFCAAGLAFTWHVPAARVLRAFFAVYALTCLAVFAVPSSVGENIARVRFVAVPVAVLALSLRGWKPLVPTLGALALAASWNVTPIAFSVARSAADPSAHAAYWQPVVRFLETSLTPDYRVEAIDTTGHWEAVYLARAGVPIARGWYRQDDFPQNRVLYRAELGAAAYLRWLRQLGVAYVVLTDAPVDYSAREEVELLRHGHTGLRPVFRSTHATVYAVPQPSGIVKGGRVVSLGRTRAVLSLPKAGRYAVALRWSPYWTAGGACVARSPGGMVVLLARRPGIVRLNFEVTARRALGTVIGRHPRCG